MSTILWAARAAVVLAGAMAAGSVCAWVQLTCEAL